jgi:hypothetical protein
MEQVQNRHTDKWTKYLYSNRQIDSELTEKLTEEETNEVKKRRLVSS